MICIQRMYIELYLRMHVTKKATQSSKNEEAFVDETDISPEFGDDLQEVQNYISAMSEAVKEFQRFPFSSQLIKQALKTLSKGLRGKQKMPGEFRTSHNWIGGASLNESIFILIPYFEVANLIGDLEKLQMMFQTPHQIY